MHVDLGRAHVLVVDEQVADLQFLERILRPLASRTRYSPRWDWVSPFIDGSPA